MLNRGLVAIVVPVVMVLTVAWIAWPRDPEVARSLPRRERLRILVASLFGTLVGVVWFFGWFGFTIMNGDLDADVPPVWTAADTFVAWMMVATLVVGPVAGLGLAFVWHLAGRRR